MPFQLNPTEKVRFRADQLKEMLRHPRLRDKTWTVATLKAELALLGFAVPDADLSAALTALVASGVITGTVS